MTYISKWIYDRSLESLGFRRRGDHLCREIDGLFHCVHFQSSQWGSASEGRFTINLCIASPVVWEIWTETPFPKNPASAQIPFTQRLGLLRPSNRDLWWNVDANSRFDLLSAEVNETLREYGIPYLNQYRIERPTSNAKRPV